MVDFSPDIIKSIEAQENLAKFQEEETGQVKIEVMAELTANQINTTTYQAKPEDFQNPPEYSGQAANLPKEPNLEPDPEPQITGDKPKFSGNKENLDKAKALKSKYLLSKINTVVQSDFGYNPSKEDILAVENREEIFAEYLFMSYYFDWVAETYIDRRSYDKSISHDRSIELNSHYRKQADVLRSSLRKLNRILNPPVQVLIPEADKIGVCNIDNKSAEVLAAEERMGIEITTKVYSETDIDYIIARNGGKITRFSRAEGTKSYEIYVDKEGAIIFDQIMIKDGLHWYTKFRENNGVIERWSKHPNYDWKKVAEYPMPAKTTASLQQ